MVFQESYAHPEVISILHLSRGVLVPAEELKNIVMYIPPGGAGTQSIAALFLDCFSLVSVFPSSPVMA